jgi:hypothetical protein
VTRVRNHVSRLQSVSTIHTFSDLGKLNEELLDDDSCGCVVLVAAALGDLQWRPRGDSAWRPLLGLRQFEIDHSPAHILSEVNYANNTRETIRS